MKNQEANQKCVFQSQTTESTTCCRNPKVANGAEIPISVCANCPLKTENRDALKVLPVRNTSDAQTETTSTHRLPSMFRQAWDFTKAVGSFVADGLRTVSKEKYEERLAICDKCEFRVGNRCLKCGCGLRIKAKGRTFDCPIGKWPKPSEED